MSDNVIQYDWGYEIIWAKENDYCGKITSFSRPGKTSMHFHKEKSKTWFINEGIFKIRWIDTKTGQYFESEVKQGATFTVPPLMPSSIECVSNEGVFTEVSNSSNTQDIHHIIPPENISLDKK